MGEIGGNDFNYGFLGNSTKEEVESYVPAVINTISSAIQVRSIPKILHVWDIYSTISILV